MHHGHQRRPRKFEIQTLFAIIRIGAIVGQLRGSQGQPGARQFVLGWHVPMEPSS